MRGLDIRIDYARAKVLDAELMLSVLIDANCQGREDFYSGCDDVPIMIKDVPELVCAWKEGWRDERELAEMMDCPGCNDCTGNPCHIHG